MTGAALAGPMLLLVDDEPDNLVVMKAVIAHYFPQCRVVTARHGEEALALTREIALDGSLLDMQMPGMSGIDLCRRLKERGAHVPVLLMSAYPSTPAIRSEGLRAGAMDFISKPVNNEELAAKIGVMLREKEGSDRLRRDNRELGAAVAERTMALQESEARLRAVVEHSPDVILSLSQEGRILYVNRAGAFPGAETGGVAVDILPASVRASFAAALEACLERGAAGELELADEAGRQWFVRLAPAPMAGEAGAMAILTDVTQKKRAERILRETEERFRLVMDHLDAVVYASDMETHELLFVNRLGKSLFGEQAEGQPCWRVFHGATRDAHTPCASYRRHCRADPLFNAPLDWQNQLDNQRWYDLRGSPVLWLNGRPALLVVATDVTRRRAMEESLRHAQRMEAVGSLTGGIAHDFNNILGALIGNLELTRIELEGNAGFPGSAAEGRLNQALVACLRGREVVRQLLAFSRPGEGRKERVELAGLVEEAMQFMKSSFAHAVQVVTRLPREPLAVLGDATQIYQVIVNLCTNANQAMGEEGGEMAITLQPLEVDAARAAVLRIEPGAYALFSCRDSGCGIAPEVLPRIFDPFFTTKEQGTGSGLGLSVVHGIVQGHGGTILVESEPGRGTLFQVFLPLLPMTEPRESSAGERMIPAAGPEEKPLVLAVDDDPTFLHVLREVLEVLGYGVDSFGDPVAALRRFRERPDAFHAVITDQQMPGLTGTALCRGIREVRAEVPVLLCTGNVQHAELESLRSDGCAVLLEKPFTVEDLAAVLRRMGGPRE